MKSSTPWLATALLLCPLGAQDAKAKPKDVSAEATATADARLEKLSAEATEIFKAWRVKQREVAEAAKNAKPGTKIPAIPMRPDLSALYPKYMAAAKDFTGDDAVKFLLGAFQMTNQVEERQQVLDTVLDKHLDSSGLGPLGGTLPFLASLTSKEYAAKAIAKIEKHGKNDLLMAWVVFGKHKSTLQTKPASSPDFVAAKTAVTTALAKIDDRRLQSQFDKIIAEQEQFGIGKVAPDIVGKDLDGVDFKLSDYKGKVVFLDFWGDW